MPELDVQVSPAFRGELRVEVDRLVRLGLGLIAGQPVEVHVRARRPRKFLVLLAPPAPHDGCRLVPYQGDVGAAFRAPLGLPPPASDRPMRFAAVSARSRRRELLLRWEADIHHGATLARWTAPATDFNGWTYNLASRRLLTLDTYRRRRRRPQPQVNPGIQVLITLRVPVDPRRVDGFPMVSRYRATVPVELEDWREAVVRVAAHEAHHALMFLLRQPAPEVAAEQWASEVLRRLRASEPLTSPHDEDAAARLGQASAAGRHPRRSRAR
jgi:hypothetical protein